jgi:hypothetical protein
MHDDDELSSEEEDEADQDSNGSSLISPFLSPLYLSFLDSSSQ